MLSCRNCCSIGQNSFVDNALFFESNSDKKTRCLHHGEFLQLSCKKSFQSSSSWFLAKKLLSLLLITMLMPNTPSSKHLSFLCSFFWWLLMQTLLVDEDGALDACFFDA